MPRAKINNRVLLVLGLAVFVVPLVALAGLSPQGLSPQGLSPQGLSPQGLSPQGLSPQGLSPQGLSPQGLSPQGLSPQGLSPQGLSPQGLSPQGLQTQGVALMGNDVVMGNFKGITISSVDMRGTTSTSPITAYELTSIPGVSTGVGNYITVGGASAVGHYAVAHTLDSTGAPAGDLDLFIAGEQADPVPNDFHRADQQDNQDELYIVYSYLPTSGEWISLCPYNPLTLSATAMAIPEDPTQPNKFIFACTATGVASKCARNWGYRPWMHTQAYVFQDPNWVLEDQDLKPFYDVCKSAAMANYCQNGTSFTKAGTLVDLFDTRQIIWPNAIQNPFNAANTDSLWMMSQEYFISFDLAGPNPPQSLQQDSALQRTRYAELSPVGAPPGSCDQFTYVTRLEHDNIEDAHWASPLTNTPRIQVFSPTSCTHDEGTVGSVLPWDCSPCTTQVCKVEPQCCGAFGGTSWDATTCVATAASLCQDGGVSWPKGLVWPTNQPSSAITEKYLIGPGGAVLRVDGTSGVSTSATVSGWACDPEWPDASVAVDIYGGAPREQGGSVLLGEVRADQALAAPLLNEVSSACDGPGKSSALHGFTFTLPANQAGDVFVYAIDAATDDGPAAPPTLIRNGIVQVPTCAHSEHVAGDLLDASCSACAGQVCGDGTHADCCTLSWTDDCAAAADACSPASSSAPTDSRVFAAATTGWIEAPTDGSYLFDASVQPSRLFINGTKVLDWFSGSGTTQGSITLMGGVRYDFRWDRFQSEPPSGGSAQGVTWQPPGASGLGPIPANALYELAPGSGTGLAATYVDNATGTPFSRTDPTIDINRDVAPPSSPPMTLPPTVTAATGYTATWEGEIIPSYNESYTFIVTGSGTPTLAIGGNPVSFPLPTGGSVAAGTCPHDLCQTGDKIAEGTLYDPACDPCVNAVCDQDPYCCNGGYLSYYSTMPVWDAKCVAEVNAYCTPQNQCTTPLPSPVSPLHYSASVPLLAGVHYHLLLQYSNPTSDPTIRLMWTSPSQATRQVVPQFALYPEGNAAAGLGAGLNVTYFATKVVSGVLQPDLSTVVGSGETADLSIAPTAGPEGTPVVSALATPGDTSVEGPQPPAVVRPRLGDTVAITGSQLDFHGIGGLTGGSIHVKVSEDESEFFIPVNADGTFAMNIPLSGVGSKTLIVSQLTYSGSCVPPAFCAESSALTWPVTVTDATSGIPPIITSPKDLTASPNPADLVLSVTGSGTPGPVALSDLGLTGATATGTSLVADATGTITGSVLLSHGSSADPRPGWHKLVFSQNGAQAAPVFVSVGINPPTVTFPRSGAQIDCSPGAPDPREFVATGGLPYPVSQLGQLVVAEETGRLHLNRVIRGDIQVSSQPGPDGLFPFQVNVALGYGRHLLYFFQAPTPDPNATPAEIDAELRAFATVANTPTSRIEVDVPPPTLPIAQGGAAILTPNANGGFTAGPPVNGIGGPLSFAVTNCGPNATPPANTLCALPFADVNVLVGSRLFTARADATGAWTLAAPAPHGWSEVTLSQVVDSAVGGAWQQSCPSNSIGVGVPTPGGPAITTPGDLTVNASSPAGAIVTFGVTAAGANSDPVTVACTPPSGSTFPLGRTAVLCTSQDTTTGGIGLASFGVTVVDGPPVLSVPTAITAEATSALGALVSWNATATDAVDGTDPVECVPTSPTQFALDVDNTVTCSATNAAGETATASFVVKVEDTTPPTLCPLPNLEVGTNAGAGAIVTFTTCATDIVDGSDPVTCDHPSGSFFPVGNTVVTCTATDEHDNTSAPSQFTVSVEDTTPPVLNLPANIAVTATSRFGARVSYVATATDNVDPHPTVSCVPPSGAQFPLGTTTVSCTATDASGNQSHGTFQVSVIVAWSGFLLPIDNDGSTHWEHGIPLPVRFLLVGASAGIPNLSARLYVAPLDASGNAGPEQPAVKLLVGGNLFDFLPIVNQYLLTMDTRALGIAAWRLRVDLGDGQTHVVRVTFTR